MVKSIAEAEIEGSVANFLGRPCAECDQIAFRTVTGYRSGKPVEVPLCGHHYLEAGIDRILRSEQDHSYNEIHF